MLELQKIFKGNDLLPEPHVDYFSGEKVDFSGDLMIILESIENYSEKCLPVPNEQGFKAFFFLKYMDKQFVNASKWIYYLPDSNELNEKLTEYFTIEN